MASSTFPLRFRKPKLREQVRAVAEREGISQNEFLEQAAEHELIIRGELLAADLDQAVTRLRGLTASARRRMIEASIVAFAEGERRPDPVEASQFTPPGQGGSVAPEPAGLRGSEAIGAIAAFEDV